MQVAARPYVMAGAVLAAASMVVVTPLAPRSIQPRVLSIETRLVDGSILNVPFNLFEDLLNVPFNEVQGYDTAASSLMFSGNWWVPSSTNIWGIDPGDTTHVAAVDGLIAPFPSLLNGVGGLNYEQDGLLAAELPTSATCDAATCAPIVAPNDVTGITTIDRDIGLIESIFGKAPDGASQLFGGWFKVPLSTLMGGHFTFGDVTDPSGQAYSGMGFGNGGLNPFEGGTVGADNAMPWANMPFTFNSMQPLENFWNSLEAPLSQGPGIEIPTFTGFLQGVNALAASFVVAFDPFVEGSSVCPAACNGFLSPDAILKLMDPSWSPTTPTAGNPIISEWLTEFANGTTNNATTSQAEASVALLQTGFFDLSPTTLATVDADLAAINPELPALLTNAGILTDPGYLAYTAEIAANQASNPVFEPVYGGYDPSLVLSDIWNLFAGGSAAADVPAAAASAIDPAGLAADTTNMLGHAGAGLGADLISILTNLF